MSPHLSTGFEPPTSGYEASALTIILTLQVIMKSYAIWQQAVNSINLEKCQKHVQSFARWQFCHLNMLIWKNVYCINIKVFSITILTLFEQKLSHRKVPVIVPRCMCNCDHFFICSDKRQSSVFCKCDAAITIHVLSTETKQEKIEVQVSNEKSLPDCNSLLKKCFK